MGRVSYHNDSLKTFNISNYAYHVRTVETAKNIVRFGDYYSSSKSESSATIPSRHVVYVKAGAPDESVFLGGSTFMKTLKEERAQQEAHARQFWTEVGKVILPRAKLKSQDDVVYDPRMTFDEFAAIFSRKI